MYWHNPCGGASDTSKITYKFALWSSNSTSKNLSQWYNGKNIERHIYKNIHYNTICNNNTGSNLRSHQYKIAWITHNPSIRVLTMLSLKRNEDARQTLLEVISLQTIKWEKGRREKYIHHLPEKRYFYWCHGKSALLGWALGDSDTRVRRLNGNAIVLNWKYQYNSLPLANTHLFPSANPWKTLE